MLQNLPSGLGRILSGLRPGINGLLFAEVNVPAVIEVSSPAFTQGGAIPALHTADGPGISPPLSWRGVPAGTTALLLVVEDADSPTPRPLVHAIVTRLPPGDGALAAGDLSGPGRPGLPGLGIGRNSYFQQGWLPPDPPPGHGPHHYAFQLFALSAWPEGLNGNPGRSAVRAALRHGVLAKGCLIGTYAR
ncbi:YbhB/YbcL family Raf kinase inhibitor-like protein [Roseomonas xinghualingensis]|uniref:YbhB/YbcL family Raf kinase inhibitor-like protein n=1 Tax=Roseomonas xinghualingensis TaxID=2986475 RepID=UPI0021F0D6A3|nr:YbhB/YbcL family Raf kinase inhibitor-like protein [Roseomonas sp. SXEYE001]MCV4206401.1 YbhB/YbcL family Raf kinase inhibitor-like protein [Roseomonas sp. SXEYE001]